MFWLCSVSLSLLDYRLIAINALIYDLIATEIVNANARIVVAATVMTEFDKSATRTITGTTTTETIAPANTKQQRFAHELSITSEATRTKTTTTMEAATTTTTANTIRSNATADVAFFGQKLNDDSDDDEISTNNNNNSNNQFTQTTNGSSNNTAQLAVPTASANVTFVSIAATAARPLAMWAHNCWRYNNNMTVMPTINGRIDNFRNGKKQTNKRTTTTTTAAKVERNVSASTVAVVAPKRTTTTTVIGATLAISKLSAIKPTVITAIKSTAMHLTTSALATPTVMTARTTEAIATATTTAGAQFAESAIDNTVTAEAFKASSKWATALATTTLTTTAAAIAVRHATPSWPTLRSHDLLSSTNGMPNCRNATSVCVPTEKSHAETNINTTATTTPLQQTTLTATTTAMESATAALLSTSSPVTSATTLQPTKVTATATATNVDAASVAYVTGSIDTTTHRVASTPVRSLTLCPTYSAPATITTTTTIEATKTTIITNNPARKSTAVALQTQWQHILSRPKRYLAFPEGTSFTVSACITVGIIGNPNNSLMSFGLNWGVAYDLPNATWVLNQLHGLSRRPRPMPVHHRRSKRAIYERIAETVDNMGYSGRDCVLRALCESRQYFARTKLGMIGEILRVIFSLPKQRIFSRELRESSDIVTYDHAYRNARSLDCVAQYDCPFSLLELAFGKYSIPSADYYGNSFM